MNRPGAKACGAFTLIEPLVVIAIIAILAAQVQAGIPYRTRSIAKNSFLGPYGYRNAGVNY